MYKKKQGSARNSDPSRPEGWLSIGDLLEAGYTGPLRDKGPKENIDAMDDPAKRRDGIIQAVEDFRTTLTRTLTNTLIDVANWGKSEFMGLREFESFREQIAPTAQAARAITSEGQRTGYPVFQEKAAALFQEVLVRDGKDGPYASPAAVTAMEAAGRIHNRERTDRSRGDMERLLRKWDYEEAARLKAQAKELMQKWKNPKPKDITPEGSHVQERKGRSIE